MHSPLRALIDILLPESCAGCGTRGSAICESCIQDIPPSWQDEDEIKSCFSYADKRIRKAILRMKYKGSRVLCEILGKHLAELVLEDISQRTLFEDIGELIIVPAPLSRERLRERGFNQSELLAREVSRLTGYTLETDLVRKTRHTPPQVKMQKRERLTNLRDAFALASSAAGRDFIVIDDVYTTGATFREIAKTLREGGARRVYGYTLAH